MRQLTASEAINDEKERQVFEQLVRNVSHSKNLTRVNDGKNYQDGEIDTAWIFFHEGWQAALISKRE